MGDYLGEILDKIIVAVVILAIGLLYAWFDKKKKKLEQQPTPDKDKTIPNKEVCKILSSFSPVNEHEIIGRDEDVTAIALKLQNTNTILLLNGMGGIGKTTLATLYAQKHKTEYNHLVWINAAQGIHEGFVGDAALARSLELDEKLKTIQEQDPAHFAENGYKEIVNALREKENGLLVIDNEQNQTPIVHELRSALEGGGKWKILITARETIQGIEPYKVDELEPEQARQLFYQYYTREKNDEQVDAINELLMRHTLMEELIAKNVNDRNGYTLVQLKDDLQSGKTAFMQLYQVSSDYWAAGKNKNEYIYSVLKNAFTIAEFEVKETDDETTKTQKQFTRQLLTYWCLMPERQPVPFDTFCLLCQLEGEKLTTENLLNKLSRLGWLEHNTNDGSYLMHPVIQQALRWQLEPQPIDLKKYLEQLFDLTNNYYAEKFSYLDANWLQTYIESVLAYFLNTNLFSQETYNIEWRIIALVSNELSLYYSQIGNYSKTLDYRLKTIAICERILDEKDEDLAVSYGNIALIYQEKGDFDKALEFALKNVTINEEILNKIDLNVAIAYSNISTIYLDKGDISKALEFALKAIEIKEKVLDNKHPSLATSFDNIGSIFLVKGDLNQTLEFALKAMKIREEVLDVKHPDLARSYNNIATVYFGKNEFFKAKEYIDKAVAIYEYNFPVGHPNLDIAKERLAKINEKLGG